MPKSFYLCNKKQGALKKVFTLIFTAFLLLTSLYDAVSQNRTVVHIKHADYLYYDARLNPDIQRLIGNVILRQDSVLFYCDSAYLNDKKHNFDAFGSVHIVVNDTVDVYADKLHYEGDTRIAELFDNVRLVDKNTVLTTEHLIYNRNTEIAYYNDYGTIVSDSNTLNSKRGYYNTGTKIFYFKIDVVLKNPDQETYSDTLIYNSNTETAFFKGPTVIRGKESTIYCERGWYDTKNDFSKMTKRPSIWSSEQSITADSIEYDNEKYYGKAFGNVIIHDTTHKVMVKGNRGEMWDKKGVSYVTDSALAITYEKNDNDTMYMHGDTLFMYFDKERKAKKMLAYNRVKIYRKDMQGVCDSLAYIMEDSTVRLYNNPVLWSGKNQLTADTIIIHVSNNNVDSIEMLNNAFIVSKDSTDTFNQIKGKKMTGYFEGKKLKTIDVDGNAQSVYYVREDDGYLIGVNKEEASYMEIVLNDNKISKIKYIEQISEVMYPAKDVPAKVKRLENFEWKEDLRPKNRLDVFKR
jgi:lipopolysaccharide export system protein LptA